MSQRASNACESCRRRKVKCSGDQPCRGCRKHNRECAYGVAGRKRFSEAYVHDLLSKIQTYEQQGGNGRRGSDDAASPEVSNRERNPDHLDIYASRGVSSLNEASSSRSNEAQNTLSNPATDLASGPGFETHARRLFGRRTEQHPPRPRRSSSSLDNSSDEDNPTFKWQYVRDLIDDESSFQLPSEAESRRLTDLFLTYLGANQHFFDQRTFSDAVNMLYRDSRSRSRQQSTLWFTQYLLVMAVAKLMDDEPGIEQRPPGANYFAQAMKKLPPLHELGEHGVIAVEILAVTAIYLSWCDKKHDAYLNIGVAMRLGIALGIFKPPQLQDCLPSEAAHRLRLWWTVYMLDRRFAAGLGMPVGADDRQIRSELPGPAAGFPSHIPIVINVSIAHTTSDIMSSLYGNTIIGQNDLVQKIQDILQSLFDMGKSIPPEFTLDFTQSPLRVTRTGGSLYLMLFHAIILCVRPIVLQFARQEIQNQDQRNSQPLTSITLRLCQTCDEAAKKIIRITSALQRKNLIARFGYFDLDATFAAAFILVILGAMEEKRTQKPPRELKLACEVLGYLAKAGNKAAERRFNDITQFCSHVWPRSRVQNLVHGSLNRTSTTAPTASSSTQITGIATQEPRASRNNDVSHRSPDGRSEQSSNDNFGPPQDMTQFNFDIAAFDLAPEADGIYSSFNDPNFPVTGMDYTDWLEAERFFAGRFSQ